MKLLNTVRATLTGLAALGLTSFGASAETTLRLGDFQATGHIISVEGTTRWMAAVQEATNGEGKFEHCPAQQAAKSKA